MTQKVVFQWVVNAGTRWRLKAAGEWYVLLLHSNWIMYRTLVCGLVKFHCFLLFVVHFVLNLFVSALISV